jgi:plastocyanin
MLKNYLRAAASVCVLVFTACDGTDDKGNTAPLSTTAVQTTSVVILNTSFTPPSILVSLGATVTFTNQDGVAHNVTFDEAAILTTGDFSTGGKSLTMPIIPGLYSYHCTIHPGMSGAVRVQ